MNWDRTVIEPVHHHPVWLVSPFDYEFTGLECFQYYHCQPKNIKREQLITGCYNMKKEKKMQKAGCGFLHNQNILKIHLAFCY